MFNHCKRAGSCLETLGAGRKLLVVINEGLMDNHQLELANQLHLDGHLHYCTCSFGSRADRYMVFPEITLPGVSFAVKSSFKSVQFAVMLIFGRWLQNMPQPAYIPIQELLQMALDA
ncbi:ALG13-like protein [Mya arenaria]|uniref:UDP-N-acetylglucosamine transferase subunit ALG13 n=1 Tax=Mya arenaria TaxID=6604 RepID=A0ABY7DB39_MYAAR|nr:ALG13-like protein [Mya arenaria]